MKHENRRAGAAAALILALAGCAGLTAAGGEYEGGDFEGTGRGFRGPVRVLVRMSAGAVAAIEILEHREDEAIGGAAMEELLELVLEYNSTDLDAVSGATESSAGFLAAVAEARNRALSADGAD
jgi:uncharacterized protein with FMN-binding domain